MPQCSGFHLLIDVMFLFENQINVLLSFQGIHDAAILANQLQLYYATENTERTKMLQQFNNEPNNFKHMDLIKQFENIQMELPTASPKTQQS